jgi:transposase
MKIVTIDDAENVILGLQDEIRRSEESRYDHRLHGVLLVAHGMNCCQVADLLGDAPRTVAYWVERFEQKGLGGLHEGSRSGRPSKLNADQIADLQRYFRASPLKWDCLEIYGMERLCRLTYEASTECNLVRDNVGVYCVSGSFATASPVR